MLHYQTLSNLFYDLRGNLPGLTFNVVIMSLSKSDITFSM